MAVVRRVDQIAFAAGAGELGEGCLVYGRYRPITRLMLGVSAAAILVASPTVGGAAPKVTKEQELATYLSDKPDRAQPLFRSAFLEGDRNLVLNLDRAGLASLQLGDDRAAALAFDKALERIESLYADNPAADKARSKFVKEATKDFKGEPYERVMALYYRGLIYLRAGDYENARASFREGELQDRLAEDQRYASDYALLEVLNGWASHCNGDDGAASDAYDSARKIRADVVIPKANDKVMLLADIGTSPEKWADGQYQQALHFKGSDYPEASVIFLSADADQALLGRAKASVDQMAAAELAAANAAKELQEKLAFASSAHGILDSMAADISSGVRSSASAPERPALPPPPVAPKGAKRAPVDPHAAERAELKRVAAEHDAMLQSALNSAIAADQADDNVTAAQSANRTAEADLGKARAGEKTALASLTPFGLKLPADFSTGTAKIDDHAIEASIGDNLLWQATSRGGRQIDVILAGKASFKEGTAKFGNGMTQGSLIAMQTANSITMQNLNLQAQGYQVNNSGANVAAGVGLAFLAIGMISNAASAAANPAADIRYWDSLPGEMRYATTPANATAYRALFKDAKGGILKSEAFSVKMDSRGRCGVGWVRSRSAVDVPASAPNSQDPKK